MSMNKISVIVSIIVFTILSVAVAIITNITNHDVNTNVLKDQTRVGLVMIGAKDDKSWNASHYEALTDIAPELNLEIICRENVSAGDSFIGTVRDLVNNDNCRIVICTSFSYDDDVGKVAEEFPDTIFLHTGGSGEKSNVSKYFGRMYQVRYLSGIIAGLQTRTDRIGFVASYAMTDVNRALNAFTLGVRSVNPDAEVHAVFIGSWSDDDAASRAAEKLINECSVDVMTTYTDTSAALRKADDKGVWTIGYNKDNYDDYPRTYLTACVWDWKDYYKEQILLCLQGKFHGESNWFGIESGIVKLKDPAEAGNAYKGYEAPLAEAEAALLSRTFDVFYGPIKDNNGVLRIGEGESMPDDRMLNNFDWYVEGVVIED